MYEKRGIKPQNENKDKTSNQQKIYYEKKKDKLLLEQNDSYKQFEELIGRWVELKVRMKALEERHTKSSPS